MPNFFELLEVKIYPRFDEGLTEAGKCAVRLRTSLEYSGAVFRAISSMRVSLRSNEEDPQPANLHEWLRDYDEELFVLARLGDALVGSADHEFCELVKLIDLGEEPAQNPDQLAAVKP